jgi:hypothetical protein
VAGGSVNGIAEVSEIKRDALRKWMIQFNSYLK